MKKSFILFLLLLNSLAYAVDCDFERGLNPKQLKTLRSADKLKRIGLNRVIFGREVYDVGVVYNGQNDQFIVLLGEAHIKGLRSSILGSKVAHQFPVRLIEGIPKKESDYIAANVKVLADSLGWQRILMRYLTFNFFGSTITASEKVGYTFLPGYDLLLLNKKRVAKPATSTSEDIVAALTPEIADSGKFINLPLESGEFLTPSSSDSYILQARNLRMAKNINFYIDQKVVKKVPLVVAGAAHLPGLMGLLEDSGYQRCTNF